MQTIGPGDALGWSWLFPPYQWRFSARSIDATEAVSFGARSLREYDEENHDFGYDLAMRIERIVLERLQSTRLLLADLYGEARE